MQKINIPIDRLVQQYNSGYSTRYLADLYNCSVITIQRRLRIANNCEFRPLGHGCKKYSINQNYFDSIDSEDKAYWLGIFLTNGSTSSRLIRLGLKKRDESHLKKFLHFLSSNHPVKYQKKSGDTPYVAIGNKHMRESLIYKGIKANDKKVFKTKEKLEKDYWRGVIDGGGQIDSKNNVLGLVGTKETCEAFRQFCKKIIKTKAEVKPHGNIWSFRLHGYIAFLVTKTLYENSSIHLDRKYKQYLQWVSQQNQSSKNLYPKVVRFFKSVLQEEVSIRRCKVPSDLEGDCSYKKNKYFIRVCKSLNDNEAINCLLHELAHVGTILEKDVHGEKFGKAYSKIYKLYENEFT